MARLDIQSSACCPALRPGLYRGRLAIPAPWSRHQYVIISYFPVSSSHPIYIDVANYNALSAASPDPITQGDPNYDELHYINVCPPLYSLALVELIFVATQALQPYLKSAGWDARFIVDQGRSGVQNIRQQWGDWCNIKGAGFGTRPTTNTGSTLIDSIVWVKPGGESDGTSNSSSPRYDSTCSLVSRANRL